MFEYQCRITKIIDGDTVDVDIEDFMPVGSSAIIKTAEKGKYGRYLGDFRVGNKWLCKELLASHNAVPYHGQSKSDIKKAHLINRKLLNEN